jgi:hypothetical protein
VKAELRATIGCFGHETGPTAEAERVSKLPPQSQISGVDLASKHVGWGCRGTGADMTTVHHPTDFNCPGCGAGYKVVRVKAEADPPHRLIHCKVCKRSLAPTDREYILKYFLIGRKQAGKQRV